MYTTPQSCTPHLSHVHHISATVTGDKQVMLLHLHGPEQVNYFNPHARGTVRPLPVQNKRRLLKLYNNTQNVPQPSFAEEIIKKHERKQSCPRTQNHHSSEKEYGNTRRGKKKKKGKETETYIHPTMRNIVRSTHNFPSLCTDSTHLHY